jgi:uncharacterized protein YneF (UPF0154 family)
MAVQANGITVLRVSSAIVGERGTAPAVEFLFGAAQVKFVWDAHQGEFIIRTPMWSDGRRNAENPRISKTELRAMLSQAYGIAKSRGWTT